MLAKRSFALGAFALAASAFSASVAAIPQPDNFDAALDRADIGVYARDSAAQRLAARATLGSQSSAFAWAPPGATRAAVAPLADARARAELAARAYLLQQRELLGVSADMLDSARLLSVHDTGRGPVIAQFAQYHDGVEVFGRRLSVMMNRDLELVATSGYFAPEAARGVKAAGSLGAAQAIAAAFADLGGTIDANQLLTKGQRHGYELFSAVDTGADFRLLNKGLRAQKVWYANGDALQPGWRVELYAETRDGHDQRAYAYVIAAGNGAILFRKNLISHAGEDFSYRVFASPSGQFRPYDSPLGTVTSPSPVSSPAETFDRVSAVANLVTLSSTEFSTNDPWLPAGATATAGNNAESYLDLASPDGYDPANGDIMPELTSAASFDYPIVADEEPSTANARNAAAVNLFYVNNWLHDHWYDAGFDEASGNAQRDNYGRGGLDGDPLHVEGQDYSGTNNANMLTPGDGESPRMQMFVFDGLPAGSLTVDEPAGVGELDWNYAAFGPSEYRVSAEVAAFVDATATLSDGCEAATNADELAGKIALIDRGNCDFVLKVANAEAAGAVGVIIANNVSGGTIVMGGESEATIPAMMVSLEDGALLRELIGSPLVVTMEKLPSTRLDGTLDNEIIAHEYFHYVSNRLVANGAGLVNSQGGGMGEGWSDFSSLMLSVLKSDAAIVGNEQFTGAYTVGSYVLGNYYYGIRRTPFSVDFALDPLTYIHTVDGVALPTTAPIQYGQDGADNSEVHNTGEIWANTLWEMYVGLVNSGRYSFGKAHQMMAEYVVAGLKMTPQAPTMLEARDGILAAALAVSADDYRIAATAFAKRGFGAEAVAASRGSRSHQGTVEDFSFDPGLTLGAFKLDLSQRSDALSYCDTDGVLDAGETGVLTLTVYPASAGRFTDSFTATVSADNSISFPSGYGLLFVPDSTGKSASSSVVIGATSRLRSNEASLALSIDPAPLLQVDAVSATPLTLTLPINVDLERSLYATDMEQTAASLADWKATLKGSGGASWTLGDYSDVGGNGQGWWVPVNQTASSAVLTGPSVRVDGDSLTLGFSSLHDLPATARALLEVRVDGGEWSTAAEFGGSSDGLVSESVVVSGLTAGQKLNFRFRAEFSGAADSGLGWLIDDVSVEGARKPVFYAEVGEDGVCAP